jgi:nitronate monooxygenase
VVGFHFGLPPLDLLARVKATGAKVISSATTVAEARWLETHGCDAVIAMGCEAGGHRGSFLTDDMSSQIGTFAWVPQVVDAVAVPVIAAGGIADARGIVAALALGASAVQIGTAFLFCPEAHPAPVHHRALEAADDDDTINVFTGRPAQGIGNRLMRELGPLSSLAPQFPSAASALAPLEATAESRGSGDYSSLWCGQASRLAPRAIPAGELTRRLAEKGPHPSRPARTLRHNERLRSRTGRQASAAHALATHLIDRTNHRSALDATAGIGACGTRRATLLPVAGALIVAIRIAATGERSLIALFGRQFPLPPQHARQGGVQQQFGRTLRRRQFHIGGNNLQLRRERTCAAVIQAEAHDIAWIQRLAQLHRNDVGGIVRPRFAVQQRQAPDVLPRLVNSQFQRAAGTQIIEAGDDANLQARHRGGLCTGGTERCQQHARQNKCWQV